MKRAVYPGTFDPPTLGHLDLIKRAAKIFNPLIVAVGTNAEKPLSAFTVDERVSMLKQITQKIPHVKIMSFSGLLVDFVKEENIDLIVRSIRNTQDFEYETLQAQMNRTLEDIETLYLAVDEKYKMISSTLVKEVAAGGRRLDAFVPNEIEEFIFNSLFQR